MDFVAVMEVASSGRAEIQDTWTYVNRVKAGRFSGLLKRDHYEHVLSGWILVHRLPKLLPDAFSQDGEGCPGSLHTGIWGCPLIGTRTNP